MTLLETPRQLLILTLGSFLSLLLALAGCGPVSRPADGFEITGKVDNPNQRGVISLMRLQEGWQVIDSVKPDGDGNFRFVGKLPGQEFVQLDFFGRQRIFFVGDNASIHVEADGSQPDGRRIVRGTEHNEALNRVLALEARREAEMAPMQQELYLAYGNGDKARMARYVDFIERANRHFRGRFRRMIADTLGPTLVGVYATRHLDRSDDFPFIDSLATQLPSGDSAPAWATQYRRDIEQDRPTARGQQAPGFRLPTPDGPPMGPEDYRGKILVMDFWASWCKPCRQQNPFMVRLYDRYKGRGVEFLSISLDRDRKAWLTAIEQDNLRWSHVSDLGFWQSAVVPLYRIESIPMIYLLDRQGRIVGKGLEGPGLERRISDLLEQEGATGAPGGQATTGPAQP